MTSMGFAPIDFKINKYRNQNIETKIQKPKYRNQNIEIKIQKSKYRNQNIENKIQKPKYGNQNIENKVVSQNITITESLAFVE